MVGWEFEGMGMLEEDVGSESGSVFTLAGGGGFSCADISGG